MVDTIHGRVAQVRLGHAGDELMATAAVGATDLFIGDAADFDEAGGWLTFNAAETGATALAYTMLDDGDVSGAPALRLAVPLAVAQPAGTLLYVWNPEPAGRVPEWVAEVADDTDGGVIEATVPHALVEKLGEELAGLAGRSVSVTRASRDSGWYVSDVLGASPVITAIKFRTAAAGARWEMDSEAANELRAYSGHPDETFPGRLLIDAIDGYPQLDLVTPTITGQRGSSLSMGGGAAALSGETASLKADYVVPGFPPPTWHESGVSAYADATSGKVALYTRDDDGTDSGDTDFLMQAAGVDYTMNTERLWVGRRAGGNAVVGTANTPFSSRTHAGQSIPNNVSTYTDVTFGTIVDEAKVSVSGSIFTAQVPGLYVISTSLAFAANATGRRDVRIVHNGGDDISHGTVAAASGIPVRVSASRTVQLAAGDTIQVQVYQNSGAALSTLGGTFQHFDMTWIGWGSLAP